LKTTVIITPPRPSRYSVADDHDHLPALTVTEEELEIESLSFWGAPGEWRAVSIADMADSEWSRMYDQYYRERIVHVLVNNVLLLRFVYTYEVDLDRIKTERDLLAWTHHLLGKTWMIRERTKRFVEAVAAIKGFRINL
jgi:hypothetical protein